MKNFRCVTCGLTKLRHPAVPVLPIVHGKIIFIEHTEMFMSTDLLFENKYRPVAKNKFCSILDKPSGTRKSRNISTSANKKYTFLKAYYKAGNAGTWNNGT